MGVIKGKVGNLKKKLLITMGCSHTQGLGCWDMNLPYPAGFNARHKEFGYWTEFNRNRFHELGWPNRLGKKLGYDKVINLGQGGSSTSAQLKRFMLKYVDKEFSEYEVLVSWLVTESLRTSFFRDGACESLMANVFDNDKKTLFDSIYKFISENGKRTDVHTTLDYVREEYINRKVVKTICELKGWNFISFHTQTHQYGDMIRYIYGDDKTHSFTDIGFIHENDENLISKFCGHFNEDGYEMISNNMFNWIKTIHPHLISNSPKDEIEWEWDGEASFNLGKL